MLPKAYRLKATTRLHHQQQYSTNYFSLKYSPTPPSTANSRVAITISKKVDKRATKRNALRRLISSGIHDYILEMQNPFDMRIILKQEVSKATRLELLKSLKDALVKCNIK